jgi:hypothetical protein
MRDLTRALTATLVVLCIFEVSCAHREMSARTGVGAADAARSGCEACEPTSTRVESTEGLEDILRDGADGQLFLHLRRTARDADAKAHDAAEAQLRAVAMTSRIPLLAQADAAVLDVDVETWFYVYTNKFNAQRVWIGDYYHAQPGQQDDAAQVPSKGVDVLRLIGGIVGVAAGLLSPTYGAYMIASGSRSALYGGGAPPDRRMLADHERYARGEQELVSKVRVTLGGRAGSFDVVSTAPGDVPPYAVHSMLIENWRQVLSVLRPPQAPLATTRSE